MSECTQALKWNGRLVGADIAGLRGRFRDVERAPCQGEAIMGAALSRVEAKQLKDCLVLVRRPEAGLEQPIVVAEKDDPASTSGPVRVVPALNFCLHVLQVLHGVGCPSMVVAEPGFDEGWIEVNPGNRPGPAANGVPQ